MLELDFVVSESLAGERIDKALCSQLPDITRSRVQQILADSGVTVNSKCVNKNYRLSFGDRVVLLAGEPKELSVCAQNIPLDVRYEDDDLIVVNKARGMVVHPAPGNPDSTLVNALLYHCAGNLSGINGIIRPGIVHRIDKDTSGLLIVAKNDAAHVSLAKQISDHSFKREYRAVLHGKFKNSSGTVNAPIGRNPNDRKKMCVTEKNSKPAVTNYEVIREFDKFTHAALRLETGRTHQIRVHMAHIGHPVAGDPVYGSKNDKTALNGQCLHAGLIGFIHPKTGEDMLIEAELPSYFTGFIERLERFNTGH